MSDNRDAEHKRGLIGWMVHNRVTPNLLMIFFLLGGLYMTYNIKQEVFPEFDLDLVSAVVIYPGASPEEVENGIILSIESVLRGLEGIKELRSSALESRGMVMAELEMGADQQKLYNDIKQAIDRITTFPKDAERPQVTLVTRRRQVLDLQLYGDFSEWVLRNAIEIVRDRLMQDPEISQVEIIGGREYQVHIEVPQQILRTYNLTLEGIAQKLSAASVELPGGQLETSGGQIMLRVRDRRDWAREFAKIPIITTASGSVLYLADIAQVKEGFEDVNRSAFYDGKRSMALEVYRVGRQTPIGVSDAVHKAMRIIEADLPPGINWAISRDSSDIYRQRLSLLLKNAFIGFLLVLALLGIFLEIRLAFWVTMGIPTSFLGTLLFLPGMDISINIISMFAFIIALGIVVDDAIVAGENIYEYRKRGMSYFQAAVLGARNVSVPITFSILTNIVAFLPLYFMPGVMGKIWRVIPLVVITVFIISWVESVLILPAHLAHSRKPKSSPGIIARGQQTFAKGLEFVIHRLYSPFLDLCLRWRAITLALCFALLILTMGYVFGRRIGIIMMPRVESDIAVVSAVLPFGSPNARAIAVSQQLSEDLQRATAKYGDRLIQGIFSVIDENKIEVIAMLTMPDIRPIGTRQVIMLWRDQLRPLPGLQSLRFEADRGGPGSGAALTIELSHSDIDTLKKASVDLAKSLSEFPNVKDIDDGYTPGKPQLDFRITKDGLSLGLTSAEIGRQVRNAFYGAQAGRQQRGRNEVRILVRLPEGERQSEYNIENLLIRIPSGSMVPLTQVAEVVRGRSYTSIERYNAQRIVTVTADVEPIGQVGQVMATLNQNIMPALMADYRGLTYRYAGRQADMQESMRGLLFGFILALIGIYFLLGIPFRSYIQPLIVMVAIPFGIVGAVIGHIIMDYNLSIMSMMGIIALSGVVVNDSLVLIDYANARRLEGYNAHDAIHTAGLRRFRPILITSLTTFGGLAPMIFETSRQARFMIPMAISLGYGILFATSIILVLVPSLYMLIDDITNFKASHKL